MTARKTARNPLDHSPAAVTRERVRRGLLQKELAGASGITPSHMSEIEKGSRNAGPELIVRMAGVLEVHPDKLRRIPLGHDLPSRFTAEALRHQARAA